MPKYEAVVVFEATRTEEQQIASIEKIEELITKNGGTIDSREAWGKRRLAYPINRRREGYYFVLTFDTPTDNAVLPELNRHLRITEEILRSLVTVAVIGKSKGNPPSPEELARYSYRPGGNRRPHGDNRESRGPAPSAAPAADAPKEASAATE